VTQKGQSMIGDYRTEALHLSLDDADIPLDTLLGIAVLALAGKNVTVQGPGGYGDPSRLQIMTAICEGGVLSVDTAEIHLAARTMLKAVLSCRTNHTDSGIASRIAGDALCANKHLPHMGGEEFVACLSRGALEAAAKHENVTLGVRVKDTRAALVKQTDGSVWQFRGARFELTGQEFAAGTHEYRYTPASGTGGADPAGDDDGEDEERTEDGAGGVPDDRPVDEVSDETTDPEAVLDRHDLAA